MFPQNTNELKSIIIDEMKRLEAIKNEIWIESTFGGNLTTPTKSDTTQVSNKTKLEARKLERLTKKFIE